MAPIAPLRLTTRASARIFSFGGGVQSHGALMLAALGRLSFDAFVFANVGSDSENPATLEYMERYTKPFCEEHRLKLVEVQRPGETLRELIMSDRKTVAIPAFTRRNGGRLRRNCTDDFKAGEVDDWTLREGYPAAIVSLGISLDEFERMRDQDWHNEFGGKKLGFWKRRSYPLVDLRLTRMDCVNLIKSFGLPEPPPSSCYFCPFKRQSWWLEMYRNDQALFQKAVEVDHRIREKETTVQGRVYLHPSAVPLEQAVGYQIPMFEEPEGCEEGYCNV